MFTMKHKPFDLLSPINLAVFSKLEESVEKLPSTEQVALETTALANAQAVELAAVQEVNQFPVLHTDIGNEPNPVEIKLPTLSSTDTLIAALEDTEVPAMYSANPSPVSILDVAEDLLQSKEHNGIPYQPMGITKEDIPLVAVKFDAGKLDWSLLPIEATEEVIKVLEFGAAKYDKNNWAKGNGFKWTRPFNAMLRHLFAWMRGEDNDPESGLSHIAHTGANVLFLLTFILNKDRYNQDDRNV